MALTERSPQRLTSFVFRNEAYPLIFRETTFIDGYPGVSCDVYEVPGRSDIDLGVVRIEGGASTPPQEVNRVSDRQKTIEKWVKGDGRLVVKRRDGTMELFEISHHYLGRLEVNVKVGDRMQWIADPFSRLEIHEICKNPAYSEGRFTNLKRL